MNIFNLERISYGRMVALSIIDYELSRRYWYTDEDRKDGHVDQILFVHEKCYGLVKPKGVDNDRLYAD